MKISQDESDFVGISRGEDGIIERATIVKDGKLMERFNYLKDYTIQI